MTLQTAFIGPGGYQTTTTTMRNLIEALAPGTGPLGDFTLTPVPAVMQLSAAAFKSMIVGGAVSQGSYFIWTDVPEVIQFQNADSQGRWDAVVLLAADDEYGSVTLRGPKFKVIKGTPAGSPVKLSDPAVAAGVGEAGAYARVADVLVPASVTNMSTATIAFVWEDIYKVHTRQFTGAACTGTVATWVDVPGGTCSPILIKVPPSGKITVRVGANMKNSDFSTSTVWLSYKLTGIINEQDYNGAKASGGGGARATAERLFTGLTPGSIVTVQPQTFYGAGVVGDTSVDAALLQAWAERF
jgi:hypothetical protein